MNIKTMIKSSFIAAFTLWSSLNYSDDTDIYYRAGAEVDAPAFVMLVLDYHSALSSTFQGCTFGDEACKASLGDELYNKLDYMNRAVDADGNRIFANLNQGAGYSEGDKIYKFDVLRAVYAHVFDQLGKVKDADGSLVGPWVGMMTTHNNDCDNSGNCSNGGYVLKAYQPFQRDDTNISIEDESDQTEPVVVISGNDRTTTSTKKIRTAPGPNGEEHIHTTTTVVLKEKLIGGEWVERSETTTESIEQSGVIDVWQSGGPYDPNGKKLELLTKMFALPLPNASAHDLQGKELYLELYQYLKGLAVINGHKGWKDFDTNDADNNIPKEMYVNGKLGQSIIVTATALDTTLDSDPDDDYVDLDKSLNSPVWDIEAEVAPIGFEAVADSYSRSSYEAPIPDSFECTELHAVNLYKDAPQVGADSDNNDDLFDAANGELTSNPTFEDVVGWLYSPNEDLLGDSGDPSGFQNLTSWFISQNPQQTNDFAAAGGTNNAIEYADDPEGLKELVNAFISIFEQIDTSSSTFVSAAVPVNVFNQAQSNDNIFIAIFKADQGKRPSWPGNLKKLKLREEDGGGSFRLIDANGDEAINQTDGRIKADALTFWTDSSNMPLADDAVYSDLTAESDLDGIELAVTANADGRFVRRGSAGHKIPGFLSGGPGMANDASATPPDDGPRKLFTDDGAGNFVALDVTLALDATYQGLLGAADAAEAAEIIRWARGLEVIPPASGDPARSWILGDALHSRPLPVNYGAQTGYAQTNLFASSSDVDDPNSDGNPDVRLFMGTNDGFFHMFKNTDPGADDITDAGNNQSGQEGWAYIPRRLLQNLQVFAKNDIPVPALNRPYGFDGAPVAYLDYGDNANLGDSGDKAFVYAGLRRGGNAYYAFDVSNADSPSLQWVIDENTTGFEDLGMTFSTPRVATVLIDGVKETVLVFGGGYHGGWSGSDRVGYDASPIDKTGLVGNAVYIVDVDDSTNNDGTGTFKLLWSATGLPDSIPSPVELVDGNNDGVIDDRAYVGDMGGNVWRIDFPPTTSGDLNSDWKITKLAELADGSSGNDPRFFHAPDVTRSTDGNGFFLAVAIGSGDRAHPLESGTNNTFYMIKDRDVLTVPSGDKDIGVAGSGASQELLDVTQSCLKGPFEDDGCELSVFPDLGNGWYFELLENGEKALAKPLIIFGRVFFTTYLPEGLDSDPCAPLPGSGLLYIVNLREGSPTRSQSDIDSSGSFSKVHEDRYRLLTSAGIPSEIVRAGGTLLTPDLKTIPIPPPAPLRSYWYEADVDH